MPDVCDENLKNFRRGGNNVQRLDTAQSFLREILEEVTQAREEARAFQDKAIEILLRIEARINPR